MNHLKNSLIVLAALIMNMLVYGQGNDIVSNLRDFQGIWKFIPPAESNDTTFTTYRIFLDNKMLRITLWKESKELSERGPYIVGFKSEYKELRTVSDLQRSGQRMVFYSASNKIPNDSIQYFEQIGAGCFASYNGIGTDEYEQPHKEQPNYFLFNFNGRDYEYYEQLTHLPNYIVKSLKQDPENWDKVRQLLPHDYKMVVNDKAIIYSQLETPTRMYILKNDVVEIYETKGDWLKIKYYIEKNNKDTGKTIESWIKRSDVE